MTYVVGQKRTISLPPAQASYIDTLVETGTYASASEVVRAGLRALRERDAAVERWLKEEVVPAYDAVQAYPGRGISRGPGPGGAACASCGSPEPNGTASTVTIVRVLYGGRDLKPLIGEEIDD